MKRRIGVLTIVLMFCFISPVGATIIVDTGPGPSSGPSVSFGDDYSLAAGFNLSRDTIITAVYGWMSGDAAGSTQTARIYSDNNGIPDTFLYGGYFTFTGPTASWLGPNNLDWLLPAGDYWVGYGGSNTSGFMPTPSTNPLSKYAYNNSFAPGWHRNDTFDFGVRIEGTVVPEPSTFLLLGAGLAGLGFVVRRRKKE
jgi:hypothetical protein